MRESWQWVLMALAFGVASCDRATEPASSGQLFTETASSGSKPIVDEDEARDEAVDVVRDQSFDDVGDTALCTDDCSGHDAGFEWAKENGVSDSSECGGKSQSFIEGCEAFAQAVDEQSEEKQSDEDDEA